MKTKTLGMIALSVVTLFLVAVMAGFVIGRAGFRSSQFSPPATMPGGGAPATPQTLPEGAPPAAQGPAGASPSSPRTGQEVLGGPQGASSGQATQPAPLTPISPSMPPGVGPTTLPESPPPAAPAAPASPAPAPSAPTGTPPPGTVPPPFVPTPAPGPATNPAFSTSSTRFHVQVGAFDDRQNAEALRLRIRSIGYAVTVTDGPPYRVWVGARLDRKTAERLIENLRTAGFEAVLSP